MTYNNLVFDNKNYIGVECENQQKTVLKDISLNGKVRDWKYKKIQSLKLSASYGRLGFKRQSKYWIKKSMKVTYCGSVLTFQECSIHNYKKLIDAKFCKDRLCPMCNGRRSILLSKQIINILHEVSKKNDMNFLFLTLTIKNCLGKNLSNEIKKLFNGFNRFFKYKVINDITIGYVRVLEITRNKKTGEFHPHFHVLIGVNPSYFKSRYYIKQDNWISLWKKAMRLDYDPSVNIKKVQSKVKGQTISAAIETGKYIVKDSDFIIEKNNQVDVKKTDESVFFLSEALYGKRLIGYGKLFKSIKNELKLQDIENENIDLIDFDENECKCPICQSDLIKSVYEWNIGLNDYIKY